MIVILIDPMTEYQNIVDRQEAEVKKDNLEAVEEMNDAINDLAVFFAKREENFTNAQAINFRDGIHQLKKSIKAI